MLNKASLASLSILGQSENSKIPNSIQQQTIASSSKLPHFIIRLSVSQSRISI
jgi:hypothetical protein